MKKIIFIFLILSFYLSEGAPNNTNKYAKEEYPTLDDRLKRGNWHNFKEFMLLRCLGEAYYNDLKLRPKAFKDLSSTIASYINWTTYDIDSDFLIKKNEDFIKKALEKKYIDNQDVLSKEKSAEMNALKCMDLYNSKELDDYVKKYIPKRPELLRQGD